MRKVLGVAVLVIGVGGLGWWAQTHNARQIEAQITEAAAQVVAHSVHGVKSSVSGRDIRLIGLADTVEEKAALLAAADAIAGRRVVLAPRLKVLPVAAPYALDVGKSGPDAPLKAQGSLPREALRDGLGLGDAAKALVLASGAPFGWEALVTSGVAALGPLERGNLDLTDDHLTLTGEALGPEQAAAAEAALAGLPKESVTRKITLLDDGTPAVFTLEYAAATGASLSGKLAKGLDVGKISTALGLPVAANVTKAKLGTASDPGVFEVFQGWLGQIETLRIDATPDGMKATVQVLPGTDAEAMQSEFELAGYDTTITAALAQGQNGALRTNAATGVPERFMAGYWLAVPQFTPDLPGCQTAADAVLAGNTIRFVSGADALDDSAVRVINDLAGIMARCAEESGLRAEIGGYTDNSGDPVANLALSQKRAVAVRKELIARGVPGTALRAIGHGDADAIADNATEEGRAQNRRTTIRWSN